ncbi:MAG: hypothetical protein QM791_06870 [Ferruginibacter sp.]
MKKYLIYLALPFYLISCKKDTPADNSGYYIKATINGKAYSSNNIITAETRFDELGYFYSVDKDSVSIGLSTVPITPSFAPGTYAFRPAAPTGTGFISYKCEWNNFLHTLTWTISDESDTRHFIIERSLDAVSFTAIAQINRTAGITSYQFTDSLSFGLYDSFYRIKIVQPDGSVSYSSVLIVSNMNFTCFFADMDGRYKGYNGSITVSSHDRTGRVVTGIFSYDILNYKNEVIKIRDGSFRIKY